MKRKYPAKIFWFNALMNFLFHFFYLFISGAILCIIGIWVKTCLIIGLIIIGLDLMLSIIEQLHIRKVALSTSDNPEFNRLMDQFYGTDDPDAIKKFIEEKISSTQPFDPDEK